MYRKSTNPSTSEDEQNDSASQDVDWGDKQDFSVISVVSDLPEGVAGYDANYGKETLPAPVEVAHRDVVILNHSIINGKLLVYDTNDKSQAWLVDARLITNKKGAISVTQEFLDSSERPYDWNSEISSLIITPDDVRLGLWFLGMTEQKPIDIRKTVAGLVSRGTLPVMKK